MKKILITGGNGDIAKAIGNVLQEIGSYEVRTPGKEEMDVTSPADVENFISQWVPDVLINNAGYVVPQSIGNCDMKTIKRTLEAHPHLCQYPKRKMLLH